MTDGVFLYVGELSDGAHALRHPKNRIVSKSAIPRFGLGNCSLTLARADEFTSIGQNDRNDTGERSRTIGGVECIHGGEQQPASPCVVEVWRAVAR